MLNINLVQQLGALTLSVNATLPSQGVTAVFGRSGAGKTSLINLIAGLAKPHSGKIYLNGRALFDSEKHINLPPEKRRIGYVFQEHRLFPHLSVEKNLRYGCKRYDHDKFLQIITLLGIAELLPRFPHRLSGGEKQRVAIGRALLSEPDMLLMDEPLSALDLPRKKELLDYLNQLAKQIAIPILYVSHSLDEIIRLADYLLLLEEGKVRAFDRTATVWQSEAFKAWQPENHRITLLELPVIRQDKDGQCYGVALGQQIIWLHTTQSYRQGEMMRFTLNSRDVSLSLHSPIHSSIRNTLYGTVCHILPENDRLMIAIDVEGVEIWVTITKWAFNALKLAIGMPLYLQIKPETL